MPRLQATLLFHRGITSREDAEAFLSCSPSLSHDPFLLPNMDRAVHRLRQAIESGEAIAVFGDFDTDGVTATALLCKALQACGAKLLPYIPNRDTEGHGLNMNAISFLKASGASILVTVDTGLTSPEEVSHAQQEGIDTIITDHHTPAQGVPPAWAIVSPRLPGSTYPFPDLTGAGLAFKLAQAIYQQYGRPLDRSCMELAALGTIADVAPLLGENRYIVRQGLHSLSSTSQPGLRSLLQLASLKAVELDTEAVSFYIAPRLNAAGRVASAYTSLRLLMAQDPQEALALASELETHNAHRQLLTAETMERIKQEASRQAREEALIMVEEEGLSPGIIGLAASRLVEQFYRPVFVVALRGEEARASGRSIQEFSIIEALKGVGHLFQRYGGHPQAAGFTASRDQVPEIRSLLQSRARQALAGIPLTPTLQIDAEVDIRSLLGDTFRFLTDLAPYGMGNPQPVFLTRSVEVAGVRYMGSRGQHLRLKLRQGGATWDAVAFNAASHWDPSTTCLDAVYTVGTDTFHQDATVRLTLLDWRSSAGK